MLPYSLREAHSREIKALLRAFGDCVRFEIKSSFCTAAVSVCLAVNLAAPLRAAQGPADELPIQNWHAPAFWDPAGSGQTAQQAQSKSQTPVQAESVPASVATLSGPLSFIAIQPCRIVNTRSTAFTGAFGPPLLSGGTYRTIPVLSSPACAIPATALAYSLNFTVVPPARLGYLSAWPTGNQPNPITSILNSPAGQIIANAAVVAAGTSGSIDVYVSDATDVIIDINGYYAPLTTVADLDVTGKITKNGANLLQATSSNTVLGIGAMPSTTVTYQSTAVGSNALKSVTTNGNFNTAVGYSALNAATTGANNTAVGTGALEHITTNNDSTAVGFLTLQYSTAANNSAVGSMALHANTSGEFNSAFGYKALSSITTASWNTAVGHEAAASTTGYSNTAVGWQALFDNTTGAYNVAIGNGSLSNNLVGQYNAGLGTGSLYYATGDHNIGIGYWAGSSLGVGDYNIDIGNQGASADANTIRIGDANQNRAFISGIRGVVTGNANAIPVYIDSTGQLGTVSSSRRFKQDIREMGDTTNALMGLRPVRFHYKAHGSDSPDQYGLVAEEVEEVAPELVVRGKNGELETVYYDRVNIMLLNEVQKQHRLIESQSKKLQSQDKDLESQRELIRQLESRLDGLEKQDR